MSGVEEALDRRHEERMANALDAYQVNALSTMKRSSASLEYMLLGLASEVGELCGKAKKVIRDKDGIYFTADPEMVDELGDVLWYVAGAARMLGVDLSLVAERNLEKLQSRAARGVIGGSGDNR